MSSTAFIDQTFAYGLVIGCSLFGIFWGLVNALLIRQVDMEDCSHLRGQDGDDEQKSLINHDNADHNSRKSPQALLDQMKYISGLIEKGAITFLRQEYIFLTVFLVLFAILLAFTAEEKLGMFYTTSAFLIGGFTSIISGYIGMRIAVYTNVRTTKESATDIQNGFVVAYRGGQVLGFVLVGLALLILQIIIIVYKALYLTEERINDAEKASAAAVESNKQALLLGKQLVDPIQLKLKPVRLMFEMISGYGLGGSTVALFGRVGGGIYTKAADVGSDLAGKVNEGLDEDSPKNPGTIADNVGDNVGDIAGMGADLFGSLAESTCAALVVASTSYDLVAHEDAIYFPLMITAVGILVSFVTTFFATNFAKVNKDNVETVVKWQLIISTLLMTGAIVPLIYSLPDEVTLSSGGSVFKATPWKLYGCVCSGLWSGFIIGWITEIYTSNAYSPVQELAEACVIGAAPNIILGLALGYMSTIIPILCIGVTIYVSFTFAGMYGIALAALGMLGCLPIALAIDGYGPISDNAGGIAEMSELHKSVRESTDKLDAAGNTTAAIGKGFAIGSACLVALALFGAFVTRVDETTVNILSPLEFSGLLIGAMLPYAFSALTMSAVGQAANEMIIEITRQFRSGLIQGEGEPDYDRCIAISTKASLRYMVAPGILVIGSPLLVGLLFGPKGVAGLLAGSIVSGVQIAISFSNTGGAWDNAKKYVESGVYSKVHKVKDSEQFVLLEKRTEAHKAAVVGDTVGDPLKDTSGPSINILIKLSAITSLVFGDFFKNNYLIGRK